MEPQRMSDKDLMRLATDAAVRSWKADKEARAADLKYRELVQEVSRRGKMEELFTRVRGLTLD